MRQPRARWSGSTLEVGEVDASVKAMVPVSATLPTGATSSLDRAGNIGDGDDRRVVGAGDVHRQRRRPAAAAVGNLDVEHVGGRRRQGVDRRCVGA